jgi:hypothetical protein
VAQMVVDVGCGDMAAVCIELGGVTWQWALLGGLSGADVAGVSVGGADVAGVGVDGH